MKKRAYFISFFVIAALILAGAVFVSVKEETKAEGTTLASGSQTEKTVTESVAKSTEAVPTTAEKKEQTRENLAKKKGASENTVSKNGTPIPTGDKKTATEQTTSTTERQGTKEPRATTQTPMEHEKATRATEEPTTVLPASTERETTEPRRATTEPAASEPSTTTPATTEPTSERAKVEKKRWVVDIPAYTEEITYTDYETHTVCTTCGAYCDGYQGGSRHLDESFQRYLNGEISMEETCGGYATVSVPITKTEWVEHEEEGHWEYYYE